MDTPKDSIRSIAFDYIIEDEMNSIEVLNLDDDPFDNVNFHPHECSACDGLGGHPCPYCADEKVCLHYETCLKCFGTGIEGETG